MSNFSTWRKFISSAKDLTWSSCSFWYWFEILQDTGGFPSSSCMFTAASAMKLYCNYLAVSCMFFFNVCSFFNWMHIFCLLLSIDQEPQCSSNWRQHAVLASTSDHTATSPCNRAVFFCEWPLRKYLRSPLAWYTRKIFMLLVFVTES